jgi:hypothetical protein
MGLVTFTVSVMAVGSWISLVTMACALARPAWSAALRPLAEVELELEEAAPELVELLEPQAASDKAAATASSTPAWRNLKEKRLRVSSGAFIYPPSETLVITDYTEFDSYHNHHLCAVKKLWKRLDNDPWITDDQVAQRARARSPVRSTDRDRADGPVRLSASGLGAT